MLDARVALLAEPIVGSAPALEARRTVAVLSAGVHEPSATAALAADLAAATATSAASFGMRIDQRVLEIRDVASDLAAASIGQDASEALRAMVTDVTGADALIAVTPVFAASFAGLFKSFFDVLDPDSLTGMPTLIGATGGSARHSLVIDHALRPLLAYFRASVMPTGVFVGPDDAGAAQSERLRARIDRAGGELAAALLSQPVPLSSTGLPPSPDAGRPRPFGSDRPGHDRRGA